MGCSPKWKPILIISIFIGIVSVSGFIALIVLWHKKLTPFQDYSVVIDAGSTHSKIFVYTWPADKSDGLGLTSRVTQVKSCSVPGGPITSITDPTEANARQYFETAMTDCANQIPSNRKSRAFIFLGGTAGLRLTAMRDAAYTNNLLNSTRAYFSTLGLRLKAPEYQIRIIDGIEEGLSGWISSNILMGQLFENNEPSKTYGVSDMGGASTQLSLFYLNATNDSYTLNLFDTDYNMYSHSYLCYGTEQLRLIYLGQLVNQANGSLSINEPCLQSDYVQELNYNDIFSTPCARGPYAPLPYLNTSDTYSFIGSGNYSECSLAVRKRLNTSVCTSTTCSFDNIYQPVPIPSTLKFIAISAWYSTFNSLAPNVSISKNSDGNYDLNSVTLIQINNAIRAVCEQPWSQLNSSDRYRPFLCFNSMYHWTLFQHGYSMNDENLKNFQIIKTIGSNEIGWTLGYMINQTNNIDPELRPERLLTKSEFSGLLSLCIVCFIISVGLYIVALKRQRGYQRQN